ncbi:MAG: type II toxin-antitoxin system HicB family antitoxin [Thermoguttaceae bacterium]|jgi:predicted HicB family RNase H-like nuclease
MMQYKGYSASVVFDDENDLFHGEVLGIRDVVTFQGRSAKELRKAFKESVDDYLDFCRQRGESPDKPVSGRFVLRISPQLHRELCKSADKAGQSLNAWIASRLEKEIGGSSSPSLKTRRKVPANRKGKTPRAALAGKKR